MLKCSNVKMNKGFTLIEVMIAIFVMAVGIVGALSLIQQTIAFAALSSSRLVASYLAQEGIEIVRNIRDGNWLEENPLWTDGIGNGIWEGDYTMTQNLEPWNSPGRYLKIDNGFYKYSPSGSQTKFKRKITIVDGTDTLKVSVLVEWQQIGKTHQVTAQEYLYNWR